jgi:hypothetical protein
MRALEACAKLCVRYNSDNKRVHNQAASWAPVLQLFSTIFLKRPKIPKSLRKH